MAKEDGQIGHCPQCGPDRYCDIVAKFRFRYNDDEHGMWGQDDHRILRCRGCETIFYQKSSVFSEDLDYFTNPVTGEQEVRPIERIFHYPEPVRYQKPHWADTLGSLMFTDRELMDLLDDVYGALNADLRVPAAIAIRTTFEAASTRVGIDPNQTFKEKLKELQSNGQIGPEEHKTLSVLIDAGNAAAHRGWKPTPAELKLLICILESFVHRILILPTEADDVRQRIPQRKRP